MQFHCYTTPIKMSTIKFILKFMTLDDEVSKKPKIEKKILSLSFSSGVASPQ
jgi:hypothetical protein